MLAQTLIGWVRRSRSIVAPFFVNGMVGDITSDDLSAFRDELGRKGLSGSAIRHVIGFMRRVMEFARMSGLIDMRPKDQGASNLTGADHMQERMKSLTEARCSLENPNEPVQCFVKIQGR